ncbi:GlxA family transcriptional regulator [Virgisporangium ochraceum]|uniref:AraC family transcriptional regulator n=1 Tax=Virgisporangium ochraceum TaxID=65505 RepID=A0A8J4A1P2_9ACTN|nr:helix-turn-helix domain-containing protein [Virgisporangium ochraceum]GIJ73591.1 AraC family transcriptional regulator [Virgisporangium ochraceum]
MKHRVVVLALDGVIPFELGIAPRIFGAAHDVDGNALYEVLTCTLDGRPVTTDAGFEVAVRHDASILATAGTVVVPPSHGLCAGVLPPGAAEALAGVRPGTRLVSICTAAYVFAAAGLLDGRTATTHWHEATHFQATYPNVRVEPDVLFVDDGDILTSAGAAAGIDLCLHLVRRDHGSQAANRVARRCVVPPWREGGQAQYIRTPVPVAADTGTAPTREWALQRLGEPLQLADLAAHARMSVRTFTRRFRDEVGMTPGQWLIRQRVEHARQLLESSDLPIDRIATVAGFGTAASMRQHLGVTLGVSPSAYRRTFRAA